MANTIAFRLKYFSGHLAISLTALTILVFLILTQWYPRYLFWTEGAYFALATLVGVDIVLGPALTLVVAKESKPRRELLTDLCLIAAFQIAAFGYGSYVLHAERPIVIPLGGRFEPKTTAFLESQALTMERFAEFPGGPPYYAALRKAETSQERSQYMQNVMNGSESNSTLLYVPFQENFQAAVAKDQLKLQELYQTNPETKTPIEAFIAKHPNQTLHFFGHKGQMKNGVVAYNAQGEYVGFVFLEAAPTQGTGSRMLTPTPTQATPDPTGGPTPPQPQPPADEATQTDQ